MWYTDGVLVPRHLQHTSELKARWLGLQHQTTRPKSDGDKDDDTIIIVMF